MEKLHNFLFKKEFEFASFLEKKSQEKTVESFLVSRVAASTLSAFAMINLVNDLAYMTYHSLAAVGHMIVHLESPLKYCSTTRNILIVVVEFFRHVSGVIFGSVVGIISPELAAKWFLPSDQKAMEVRSENMTPEQAKRLYTMTRDIHEIFTEKGIQYCMTGGTQLGATRHEGMIPWDDDVDLFVMEAQQEQIKALKEELQANGIGMIACHLGLKFFDVNGESIQEGELEYKYPFIDICFGAFDERDRFTYVDEHFKQNYAGEYLTREEWEGRTLQTFGKMELYGAPNPENFCKRMYGDNVFEYGYQLLNHRTFGLEIPFKYYLAKNPNGKCNCIEDLS